MVDSRADVLVVNLVYSKEMNLVELLAVLKEVLKAVMKEILLVE